MQPIDRNPEDVRRGATIAALRKAYGLTGEQLAVGISISRRYLTMIETGDRPAKVILCRKIADFLGIPLAAITVENYDEIVAAAKAGEAEGGEEAPEALAS
jgi:transcriptional regulator with XRE-family HTH domain